MDFICAFKKVTAARIEQFCCALCWVLLAGFCLRPVSLAGDPLVTLEYRVAGTRFQVSPAALSVPKGIAGSVLPALTGPPAGDAYVEAVLRGPAFPARRVVSKPNEPLLLPPLNLVGDYQLDNIRLV